MSNTLEDILYERYAKLVLASKRAGMLYPTWEEYLKEWSTDNE
jgi:hypothetical protein